MTFALLLPAGCAASRPVRGWIPEQEADKTCLDFRFIGDEGEARSLRNLLGDHTVLVFARCDKDAHGPATELLEAIVDENRRASLAKGAGVDVH